MSRFAFLLDSGATRPCKARTLDEARSALDGHNAEHRDGMNERARCRDAGDYMNFPLVLPRLAVGLVRRKRKGRGV